jgi:hypothetical protein
MADIVERLRAWQSYKVPLEYLHEAADEIERLREELNTVHAHMRHLRTEIERLRLQCSEWAKLSIASPGSDVAG